MLERGNETKDMTNHWNQSHSTFRTGEPIDHRKAKNFVANGLREIGYVAKCEYPLVDPLVPNYKHNYDIVAFGEIIIVEIDDMDLHSKPKKQANDRRAENHAEEQFYNMNFIRLDKDEINNTNKEEVAEYLQMNLWDRIQRG